MERGERSKARPLDASAASLTVGLCVVWGFNQVIAKAALVDVGPIAQGGARSAMGVVCVIGIAALTGRRVFQIDGTEAAGSLAGAAVPAEFIALYDGALDDGGARDCLPVHRAFLRRARRRFAS